MIIRKLPHEPKTLFLTFDDGPHPEQTPKVLSILAHHGIKATFFIVAQKASDYKNLTHEILAHGHTIGNHSLDHSYKIFFKGPQALEQWICKSQEVFQKIGVAYIVGFRPPAGIVTPPLKFVLRKLKIPLILWNVRYYDSTWKWTIKKAKRSLLHMKGGSIILLHDVQKNKNESSFLEALNFFIAESLAQGFQFKALDAKKY